MSNVINPVPPPLRSGYIPEQEEKLWEVCVPVS